MADLQDEQTYKWLSWMRFLQYDGDMLVLAQYKSGGGDSDDDQYAASWKAENIGTISLQNERKVLQMIKKLCTEALKLYQTTLQEDMEILAKDDKE